MLDRRGFLKLGGATAFAALFGGCERLPKKLIPFVIPPEDVALGESLWYASVCRQCPAGCGIVVRVAEGRAKKIEGNPLHPVNRGKLCARGQAGLQVLYHPDRLGTPLKLAGPRGSGKFTEITWEEGLSLLMGGLSKVRAEAPAKLLMLTDPMRGHRNLVAARFMRAFGSPHRVAWDPYGQDALLAANQAAFGIRDVPEFDIAGTRYLLSFSGDFLEAGISPVHYGRAYGRMRQERSTVRGKFVHIGPRLSMTAANADVFLPVAPGTEGHVALAIAHVIVREKLTPAARAAKALWDSGLSRMTPEAVGKAAGAAPADIETVAREFAENQPGLAIGGTSAATCTNGTFHLSCVALLNLLAGSVGNPGGISFPTRVSRHFSRYGPDAGFLLPEPESGFPAVRDAVNKMRGGAFRMALLAGATNPAFTLPPALSFGEALLSVPQIVAFSSFLDETSSLADLVLPVPSYLEEWGDDIPPSGHAGEAVTFAQPVVEPFRDTRPMPDILIAAAKELGGPVAAALPWESLRDCVEQAYAGMGVDVEEARKNGGVFPGTPSPPRPSRNGRPSLPKALDAKFEGDPARYPLLLHLYPSIAHSDGRGANLSWLQELPDPVTTAVWRNWVEVSPNTAEAMGLADGDGVTVTSPFGKIEAFVFLHPAMAEGVAAMPLGQGHTRYGKNAGGRGGNPFALLPAAEETVAKGPAWQSTRVALAKAPVKGKLVRAVSPEGQWLYENIL